MRLCGNSPLGNDKPSRPRRSPIASPTRSSDLHSSTMHEWNSDHPDCWSNLVAIPRCLFVCKVTLLVGCGPTSGDRKHWRILRSYWVLLGCSETMASRTLWLHFSDSLGQSSQSPRLSWASSGNVAWFDGWKHTPKVWQLRTPSSRFRHSAQEGKNPIVVFQRLSHDPLTHFDT